MFRSTRFNAFSSYATAKVRTNSKSKKNNIKLFRHLQIFTKQWLATILRFKLHIVEFVQKGIMAYEFYKLPTLRIITKTALQITHFGFSFA